MQPLLVVSIDFERTWGGDADEAGGSERASIVGARKAVPAILELAERYGVSGKWATCFNLWLEMRSGYRKLVHPPYHRIHENRCSEKENGLQFGAIIDRPHSRLPMSGVG